MKKVKRAPASGIDARYLRPGGNRRVRRRRHARVILKAVFWSLLWLGGAGVATTGFVQGWRIMRQPHRFPVQRIVVRGGGAALDEQLRASLADVLDKNILTLDLHAVEKRALADPWVAQVSVWRQVPGTLQVMVAPREVAALVEMAGAIHMLASDGADLGILTREYAQEDPLLITGVDASDDEMIAGRIARGLRVVKRLESAAPAFAASVSTLNVSRQDRVEATLRDFWPPVYLNPADPSLNVDRLPMVRRYLAAGGVEPAYVDLRFKDRIAVMPEDAGEVSRGA